MEGDERDTSGQSTGHNIAFFFHSRFSIISSRLEGLGKYNSTSIKILGMVSLILGVILTLMSLFALVNNEYYQAFLYPAPFFLFPGFYMYYRFRYSQMSASVGILLITVTWIICFIAAIIPFMMHDMGIMDSIYEGISGFTTTGSSMFDMNDYTESGYAILLWRSVIEWMGGITVVLVFAFLLPMIGMGGRNLGSSEFGGDTAEIKQNIRSSAMGFFKVYLLLTIIETLILTAMGLGGADSDRLTPFNALCIAMSNVSTGGLLPFPDSMASFSFPVQFVTLIFMILGATNFFLLIRSVSRRRILLFRNKEWTVMIVWFLLAAMLISVDLIYNKMYLSNEVGAIWEAIYAVVSAGTSAGFAVSNYAYWPLSGMIMLLIIQFVGGCSGSTAGGMKVHRLMAIKAYIASGMERTMHPGAVSVMQVDGRAIDPDQASSILSTVLLYIMTLLIGTVSVLILENTDILTTLQITVSAVSNAGAVVGTGTLSVSISPATKIILCFMMYLGRMEMVYVLILFTRRFWSDVAQSTKRHSDITPRKRRY